MRYCSDIGGSKQRSDMGTGSWGGGVRVWQLDFEFVIFGSFAKIFVLELSICQRLAQSQYTRVVGERGALAMKESS